MSDTPDERVAAVVVNWNGGEDTQRALAAIQAQSLPPAELVVVDNGSRDGSREWCEHQPGVRVVRNARNAGFAWAVNQGLAASSSPLVLLCNQDVVLDPGFLRAAVRRMAVDPGAGTVGGRLRRATGGVAGPLDSAGHQLHRSGWVVNRGEGELDRGRFASPEEVFGASAAAVLYRRSMLEDVAVQGEVFCADFFSYLEDVDLDWRSHWRGWRSLYEPSATASHRRSGSGLRGTAAIQRHVVANHISVWVRNAPPGWVRGPRLGSFLAFMTLRLGLTLGSHPSAVLGLVDACRQLPRHRRARREIMERRKVEEGVIDALALPTPWLRLLLAPWRRRLGRRAGSRA